MLMLKEQVHVHMVISLMRKVQTEMLTTYLRTLLLLFIFFTVRFATM